MSYELNSYGIESLVKKATDSMLLDADYTLIFEIVDLVSAHPESCIPGLINALKKLISPSAFQSTMSALWATSPYSGKDKKESEMEQRDVTVRALLLVEALMKNTKSGELIVTIGSKDFLNFLRKKGTEKKCDIVVQQKILGMMQSWAIAFSSNQIDPRKGTYHDFGSGDSKVHFVSVVRHMKEDRTNFPLPITGDSDAYANTVEALKRYISGSKHDREKERNSRYASPGGGGSPNIRDHPAYPKRQAKVKRVTDDLETGRSVNDLLIDVIRASESSDLGYELATNLAGIHKRLKKAIEEGDLLRSEEGKLLEDVLVLLEDIAATLAAYDILQRGGIPPSVKKRVQREGRSSPKVEVEALTQNRSQKAAPPVLRNPKPSSGGAGLPGAAAKKKPAVDDDDEFAALAKERKVKEGSSPSISSSNNTPDLFSLVGSPVLGQQQQQPATSSSPATAVYSPFQTSHNPNPVSNPTFSSPLVSNSHTAAPSFTSPLVNASQPAGYASSPLAGRVSNSSGNPFLGDSSNGGFAPPPSRTMSVLPGTTNTLGGNTTAPSVPNFGGAPTANTGASVGVSNNNNNNNNAAQFGNSPQLASPFFNPVQVSNSPQMHRPQQQQQQQQPQQQQSPFFGLAPAAQAGGSSTSSTPFDAVSAFGSNSSGTGSLLD